MFFALQLDRGNITQALSDNMLADLGMITDQYNYGMTIFYLCFLCAELPSQMISKKLGPDVCKLGLFLFQCMRCVWAVNNFVQFHYLWDNYPRDGLLEKQWRRDWVDQVIYHTTQYEVWHKRLAKTLFVPSFARVSCI